MPNAKSKSNKLTKKESKMGKNATRSGKKTSKLRWIALVAFIAVGITVFSVLQSPITLSSGFVTVRLSAFNGYPAVDGTTFTANGVGFSGEDGYFLIPDASGVMWRGYAQLGNIKVGNSTFVGWQFVNNVSVAVYKYPFTYDVLVYTTMKAFDVIPYTVGTHYETQYAYMGFAKYNMPWPMDPIWIPVDADYGYASMNYLSYDNDQRDARLNAQLHANVQFEWTFDIAKYGQGLPLSFNETTGVYSLSGFDVTDVECFADPITDATGGYLSEPSVQYDDYDAGLTLQTANQTSVAAGTPAGQANTVTTDIATAIHNAADSSGVARSDEWTIAQSNSGLVSSGSAYSFLKSRGTPIALSTDGNVTAHHLNDAKITGSAPFLLQPLTSIYQTTYTVHEWDVTSAANGVTAKHLAHNPTLPTLINVDNVWEIAKVQGAFTIGSNYTWTPYEGGSSYPPIAPPIIDGDNSTINPKPQNYVSGAGGQIPDFSTGTDVLPYIIWIVVGILGVVVIVVLIKYKKNAGSDSRGEKATTVINLGKPGVR